MSKYDNIINLPHYELKNHRRMSMDSRAAQFSPFAALTGYSEAVKETARLTNNKRDISEDMKSIIDMKLQIIGENIKGRPEINVLYFEADKRKNGGEYIEYSGNVKRIDTVEEVMIFTTNKKIYLKNIYDITSETLKI